MTIAKESVHALDQNDPLSSYQNEFQVSDKNLCYLNAQDNISEVT